MLPASVTLYAGQLQIAQEEDTDSQAALPPAGTWFFTCHQQPHGSGELLLIKLTNGSVVYQGTGGPASLHPKLAPSCHPLHDLSIQSKAGSCSFATLNGQYIEADLDIPNTNCIQANNLATTRYSESGQGLFARHSAHMASMLPATPSYSHHSMMTMALHAGCV